MRLAHQPACTCYQQPSFKKTMQKIHITLLIILSSVFFSAGAIAQNKPLACQVDKSAGLSWENGQWATTSFTTGKFILIQTKDGLTTESVAKVFKTGKSEVFCMNFGRALPNTNCTSWYGENLVFDPKNLNGAVTRLLGALGPSTAKSRDSLSVEAFSCTPF